MGEQAKLQYDRETIRRTIDQAKEVVRLARLLVQDSKVLYDTSAELVRKSQAFKEAKPR